MQYYIVWMLISKFFLHHHDVKYDYRWRIGTFAYGCHCAARNGGCHANSTLPVSLHQITDARSHAGDNIKSFASWHIILSPFMIYFSFPLSFALFLLLVVSVLVLVLYLPLALLEVTLLLRSNLLLSRSVFLLCGIVTVSSLEEGEKSGNCMSLFMVTSSVDR